MAANAPVLGWCRPACAPLCLQLELHQLAVSHRDDALSGLVESHVMDVHRRLLLMDKLAGLQVHEDEETVGGAADAQQPFTLGVEGEAVDNALAPVRRELV